MNDWTRQERSEAVPAAANEARTWNSRSPDARAKDSTRRRRIGFAAVFLGGVLMLAGAAMVAAAVL